MSEVVWIRDVPAGWPHRRRRVQWPEASRSRRWSEEAPDEPDLRGRAVEQTRRHATATATATATSALRSDQADQGQREQSRERVVRTAAGAGASNGSRLAWSDVIRSGPPTQQCLANGR